MFGGGTKRVVQHQKCRLMSSTPPTVEPLFIVVFDLSRDIFCAGRVAEEDLHRTMKACGGAIQTSVNGLGADVLGTCEIFQEEQIGGERLVINKCGKGSSHALVKLIYLTILHRDLLSKYQKFYFVVA